LSVDQRTVNRRHSPEHFIAMAYSDDGEQLTVISPHVQSRQVESK